MKFILVFLIVLTPSHSSPQNDDYDYMNNITPLKGDSGGEKGGRPPEAVVPNEIEDFDDNYDEEEDPILGLSPEDEDLLDYTNALNGRGLLLQSGLKLIHKGISSLTGDTIANKEKRRNKIRYYIHDKRSGSKLWYLMNRDGSIGNDKWHADGDVKVLIHGFTPFLHLTTIEKIRKSKLWEMGNAYASLGKRYNIIVVDWTELSSYPLTSYFHAVDGVKITGKDVGEFLNRLKEKGRITDWGKVHLIGFSLGGHIVGTIGDWVKNNGGGTIGRITGLDPAGPLFHNLGKLPSDLSGVLDPSDAEFVDVIHCNMGKVIDLGTPVQSGHADFYPNGGKRQPDCGLLSAPRSCSHHKCVKYFLESIQGVKRLGCPCESYTLFQRNKCDCSGNERPPMGENCPSSAKGAFYLNT